MKKWTNTTNSILILMVRSSIAAAGKNLERAPTPMPMIHKVFICGFQDAGLGTVGSFLIFSFFSFFPIRV